MQNNIQSFIRQIEQEKEVKVLFACESGSRAWGFASPDSDYDVRIIYQHKPEWYLSIRDRKDTLEWPIADTLDVSGWDVRKALSLFRTSNASIYEWLESPIIYTNHEQFREKLWELHSYYFSPKAAALHYLGLAKGTIKSAISGNQIQLKKYFYILRPLLAAKWIVEKQIPAPVSFEPLWKNASIPVQIQQYIQFLLKQKETALEGQTIQLIPDLQEFNLYLLDFCERKTSELSPRLADEEPLDLFFRELISNTRFD